MRTGRDAVFIIDNKGNKYIEGSSKTEEFVNSMHNVHSSDIQLYGIKRSGHHAVVYWILGHYDDYIYYNNCIVANNVIRSEEVYKSKPPGRSPLVFLSFEDRQYAIKRSNPKFLGATLHNPRLYRVLVIRDPFNNYASRFKSARDFSNIAYETLVWKELAKEYLGITSYLGEDVIKINYNEWFRSKSYRKEISANFGEFTDKNFDFVPGIGGGSSFDRRKYDGKSKNMQVLTRWRDYINNERFYKTVILDHELMDLASQIFGNPFKVL